MKNFKNVLKITLISMIALAFVPLSSAYAVPTILVDPYDNISKIGTSQLQITGAGLTPGRTVVAIQWSTAPYSVDEGDLHNDGVKTEPMIRGAFTVDSNGMLSGVVNVTYDARPGGTITYCDTIPDLRRSCVLEFRYNPTGTLPGEVILSQKLYFGMSAPVVTPPPATEPLTKDDCKGDKWADFTSFGFKNQGACVSFVATKPE